MIRTPPRVGVRRWSWFDPGDSIVAGYIEFKQTIFFLGAGPDIMDHEGSPRRTCAIADNHNVRPVRGTVPVTKSPARYSLWFLLMGTS